nr:MAG TPA: hypothetical protein [Caudoviricetes sp.]
MGSDSWPGLVSEKLPAAMTRASLLKSASSTRRA